MLELYPKFRGKYSIFHVCVHSICCDDLCQIIMEGCQVIRGAEFLKELPYSGKLWQALNLVNQSSECIGEF